MCEIIDKYIALGEARGEARGRAIARIDEAKKLIKAGITNYEAIINSRLYTPQELAAIAAP